MTRAKSPSKKQLGLLAALGVLLLAWKQRVGKGDVLLGPITVKAVPTSLSSSQNDAVQRFTLALVRSRQLMGADPNTVASRQPSASEAAYIQSMLDAGKALAAQTNGLVPYPSAEAQRFALAKTLPGSALQQTNAVLYALLGVDPSNANEATIPLTPALDTQARSLIAQWRPYSSAAVDTLFVLLDEARELAGDAA